MTIRLRELEELVRTLKNPDFQPTVHNLLEAIDTVVETVASYVDHDEDEDED